MRSPITGKEMSVIKEWRTMNYRKDEFKVIFHSYKCKDTGEQFEDEAYAQLNYNQLVNQYRFKYNIPFPEQISSIRKMYNLSAAKMSEILGFGTNGYRHYEGGEVPNQSNAKLIQLASDPHEFKKLLEISTINDQKFILKTHKTIDNLLEMRKKNKFEKLLENYFFGAYLPSSLTGYRTANFNKFSEMVIFFTERIEPWKTKLNKLLFYSDFIMYKQTGFSISGVPYRAIPMGPVPNNFNSIFEYLANKNSLIIHYKNFHNGGIGEQFKANPNKTFNSEIFMENEIQILEAVAERFKNTSTKDIVEISHKEKAWIENQYERKLIDYNYGFELS